MRTVLPATGRPTQVGCAQLVALDHRHRQAFGGAIGGPDLRVLRQHRLHSRHHRRRHRGAGRGDLAQGRELHALRFAVATQGVEQGRRAKHPGHPEGLDRLDQLARIGARRAGRVHVRNHAGQAQRRVEQGERRKRRQVDATGFDAQGLAQQIDLGDEVAVTVDHALGHAGRSRGEQDRGDLVRGGVGHREIEQGAARLQRRQLRPAPEPAASDGHRQAHAAARPAQQLARGVRQRDADEGHRRRLVQALAQGALADARIDQHRHRAELEKREHQQEQLGRGPHHQRRVHAAREASLAQSGGDGAAAAVEFGVTERDVIGDAAIGATAAGAANGDLLGPLGGHPR